jgi:hypothetical protein
MKANIPDYQFKKFNNLLILDLKSDKNNHTIAKCKCDCGKICNKKLSMVKIGHVKSCGCLAQKNRFTKNSKHKLLNNFSENNKISTYWAGFLFGDGSIDTNNKLQVCLGLDSKKHLQKLSIFLIGKDIVKTYNDRCQFQITNDTLAKNLSKFGIVPRKTYNSSIILPKNKKLHKHFIRGYLDADGWISLKKDRTYEYVNIGICSYLKDNLDIVAKNIPVPNKEAKKIKRRNLYELRYYSKKDVNLVINYLFDDSIYLETKWKKIAHLIG